MNVKGVSIIVGVAVVILLVVLLPIKPGDVPPLTRDDIEIRDEATLEVGLDREDNVEIKDEFSIGIGYEDAPTITETVKMEKENGTEFYIDENGTKHFVIKATDAPTLE